MRNCLFSPFIWHLPNLETRVWLSLVSFRLEKLFLPSPSPSFFSAVKRQ